MGIASLKQTPQDWITQQWVILFGKKIILTQDEWLIGPFGNTDGIGQKFIEQLATKENLEIDKNGDKRGLLQSIDQLNLPQQDVAILSKQVIDFYENTGGYEFDLKVIWNPFFRIFDGLLKVFFSNRIQQLNLPTENTANSETLNSEIICLVDKNTKQLQRTIWLRTFRKSEQVVYSGVYETCTIPSGKTCIKAIFPLPNGNATVILKPTVGNNGELILESSGEKMGDSGFYFLLKDSKGVLWTKYIRSFRDTLVVRSENGIIKAEQTLTLGKLRVLTFEYNIKKIINNSN